MTRPSCLPICVVLSLAPVLSLPAPASGENPVSPEIPFELQRNRIILPVRAEGSEILRVVLDTGMPIDGIYLFQKDIADQIEGGEPQEVRVGGAGSGEASTALLFDSTSVYVGDIEFPNRLVVISQSAGTQDLPRGGVIGNTLLADHALEVDYDRSVIRLHPTGYVPDSTWTRIDLSIQKTIPWLVAELSVDGKEDHTLDVYIDLASGEPIELLLRPGMKFGLPEELSEERYIGTGLSGDIHGRQGQVARFRIGPHEIRDIAAEFVEAEVRSKQDGADGIIGNGLLFRFHVIFNLTEETLYLKPNRYFQDPGHPGEN